MEYSEKLKKYIFLLEQPYDVTVQYLLSKYGPATDNYFTEQSYEKFLKGERKTLAKGKISRTSEGLYCHHIDEDKFENMAVESFIRNQEIPYQFQTKERLVYCNLIEHAIMHAQITKETNGKYGYKGLLFFLIPNIGEWFIEQVQPTRTWEINCKNSSFLLPEEARCFLQELEKYLHAIDNSSV